MPSGTITSLGMGSSLDLQGIIDSLRKADEAVITQKNKEKTDLEARKNEFNTINAKLLSMKSSALNLSLSSSYLVRTVKVSNTDVVSATATDGADTGSFSIETLRMASRSSFVSSGKSSFSNSVNVPTIQKSVSGFSNTDTETVLAEDENLSVVYGQGDDRKTITITGDADGMTLDDIVAEINGHADNDDGEGGTYVTASTYQDDDGAYHLQFAATSGGSGEANRVMVTEVPETTKFEADAATFSYSLNGGSAVSISVPADASLAFLAGLINTDENNPGVTASVVNTGSGQVPYKLVLKSNNSGESARIDILTQLTDFTLTEEHGSGFTMEADNAVSVSSSSPIVIQASQNNNVILFQEDMGSGYSADLTATIADGVYQNSDDLVKAVEEALEAASLANGNGVDYTVSYDTNTGKINIEEAGTLTNLQIKWGDPGSTAASKLGFTTTQTITPAASSLNSRIKIDGLSYQRESNSSLTDIIEGVTLTLKATGTSNLDISSDTTEITNDIKKLVTDLNELIKEIDANDDYDEDKDEWGTLAKTPSIRSAKETLLSILSTKLNTGTGITSMFDLGLEIEKDGTISLDESVLSGKISSDFDSVKTFFYGEEDRFTGMADRLNEQLREFTKTEGLIDSETDAVDARIKRLEEDIESETERIDKKYETMTQQFVRLDQYMREMESQQSYINRIFSASKGSDNS